MSPKPSFQIVAASDEDWPRHSEGSIAAVRDGRLLLAWTAFYGGYSDYSPAHIMARWSEDGGGTWGERFVLKDNDGGRNVMNASVAMLSDGSLGFVYHRKESPREMLPIFRRSTGEGTTLGDDVVLSPVMDGFWTACNDGLIQLSDGRLLIPIQDGTATTPGRPGANNPTTARILAAFSDDLGQTWNTSSTAVPTPDHVPQTEPAAYEKGDGSLGLLMRSKLGTLQAASSLDRGDSFLEPYDTGLESPASPCNVARIPSMGDLLLVWNKSNPYGAESTTPRSPPTTAISRDDGETWENFKDIARHLGFAYSYTYPAISFVDDSALILYTLGEGDSYLKHKTHWHNSSLKLATAPVRWFYQ